MTSRERGRDHNKAAQSPDVERVVGMLKKLDIYNEKEQLYT